MTTLTSCSQTTTQHTFGIHRWSYSFLPSYFLLQMYHLVLLYSDVFRYDCVSVWGLVRVSLAVTLIIQYDSGLGCVFFMPLLATCCDYIYILLRYRHQAEQFVTLLCICADCWKTREQLQHDADGQIALSELCRNVKNILLLIITG